MYARGNPTEIDIDKIATIVAEESIGLVNIIDVNGLSTVILMCRCNRSENLIRCIKSLMKNTAIEGCSLDVNYQDRNSYTSTFIIFTVIIKEMILLKYWTF